MNVEEVGALKEERLEAKLFGMEVEEMLGEEVWKYLKRLACSRGMRR